MTSSDAPLLVRKALAEDPSGIARHLADELERIAADLRSGEYAPGEMEPVLGLMAALAQDALRPASDREESYAERHLEGIDDPGWMRAALKSIQRMQEAVISGGLERLEPAAETARQIERSFAALSEGLKALVDQWFRKESLREAELLAQVFHDLRSPLTSVMFLSDALYSGQSGPLTDAQRRQVQLIYTASLTLLTLVDNVLNSRHLEAGEIEPEHVPFSLTALADEIERITGPLAAQRKLSLEFRAGCRTARVGDPDALRRVLLNLVTNAINYTEEGGITVRFQEAAESDLLILVEDTGPGIGDQALADLFTPFRRQHGDGGGRRFSGAGLGLSICHRLTRLMQGDIWVDTELGEGSRFAVQVPFPPVPESQA